MSGKLKIIVAVGAVVVVGTIVTVIALSSGSGKPARDLVKIELRAKPVAELEMKGRKLGRSPIVVQLPRGKDPVEVKATFKLHKLNVMDQTKHTETRVQLKSFVPDDHQAVDFDVKDATVAKPE